ncbi:thioesterase [Actinomadura sp. CNU-125]|nr:thioesterase [Actinomadura sp. CNU-125]
MTAGGGASLKDAPAETAAIRLLLLPHAGGGAASFTHWPALFPPTISAVRVQLPGREEAAAQPPFRRVHHAVDALLPLMRRLGEAPMALYGHSMGALVAFELARSLGVAGMPPVHLFVSGRRAPHLPARSAPIHGLPEDAFVEAVERLGGIPSAAGRSRAFRRYAVPLIRADLELSEEYTHHPGPLLTCPITAFRGDSDPIVDVAEARGWSTRTDARFRLHTFAGDHFFHQANREVMARTITLALQEGG